MSMCSGISIFRTGGAAGLHICICRALPVTSKFRLTWSDLSDVMTPLMVLICGVFQALCFDSCGWVSFFCSSVPVNACRRDPFSDAYLNQLLLLRCQVKE